MTVPDRLRRPLLFAAFAFYIGDFIAFLVFERPGLGIGHGFYVAIACAALSTNALGGAVAGVVATGFYSAGVYFNPKLAGVEIPTVATAIRFVAYVLVGVLIGHYAARSRALLAQADELMEELRILSRRDFLTALPNQRAFELAVNRRLAEGARFSLVICDLPPARNGFPSVDELITYSERLRDIVEPDADVARVTNDQFAVLVSVDDGRAAAVLTSRIERALAVGGRPAIAGWSTFPRDAQDALGLYTAASERLYARRIAKGEWNEPIGAASIRG